MNDGREKNALLNSLPAEQSLDDAVGDVRPMCARKLAGLGAASGLLAVALCAAAFAPVALGQGQAGAAQSQASNAAKPAAAAGATETNATSTQNSTQNSAHKSADAATQTEPQMQDQSAPAAESLGEAARKARAQKANASKPKVYTDDSVQNLSGHGVSVVGDGAGGGGSSYAGDASASAGAGASGGQAPAGGNQEQYWRGRAAAIRNQMAQCDQKISEIQDDIAKHGAVTVDPMSGAQAGVIYVEDRNQEIKKVEQQKAGLQGQLEALEEEGRKAGADSGWFR
jgi:hypothetical protein